MGVVAQWEWKWLVMVILLLVDKSVLMSEDSNDSRDSGWVGSGFQHVVSSVLSSVVIPDSCKHLLVQVKGCIRCAVCFLRATLGSSIVLWSIGCSGNDVSDMLSGMLLMLSVVVVRC